MIYRVCFILAVIIFGNVCCATNGSYVEQIARPEVDIEQLTQCADLKFEQALSQNDKSSQSELLIQARAMYYTIVNEDKGNIYSIVQLARIHDLQNNDKYAKAYFSRALAINHKDANANLYFGDYFYKRGFYKKALWFYRKAFESGLTENHDILYKMGNSYEKLGDLERANIYYKKLYLLNQDENVADKIFGIENTKYKNTGYYLRKPTYTK